VTDNGSPALYDEKPFSVTVKEINQAPVLSVPGPQTVNEGTLLSFTVSATDPDLPANTKTLSASGVPAGASFDSSSGLFTWTPAESQGPQDYTVTFRVVDNGSPTLSDTKSVAIHVNEVNSPPTLSAIGNKAVNELATLTFTAIATDSDLPSNVISYSLVGAPPGASINTSTGVFTWTPTEAQGPGTYPFTVKATDNGSPALSDSKPVTVTVNEVNTSPIAKADSATTFSYTPADINVLANDTDSDLPANTLSISSFTTLTKGGTVTLKTSVTPNVLSYTPAAGFTGTDTFTYTISDGNGGTASATVTITVKASTLTFGTPVNISNNAGSSMTPELLAVGPSTLLLVWSDDTSGNSEIWFAKSTDGGITFGTPINISKTSGTSKGPTISVGVNNNNIYIAWTELISNNNEIYLSKSADGGATFSAGVNISSNSGISDSPQLAVWPGSSSSTDTVYVAWRDTTNSTQTGDIFLKKSTNSAGSFGKVTNVSKNSGESKDVDIVAISAATIYLVYADNTGLKGTGNFDIMFTKSTDGGVTFTSSINLSSNTGGSLTPQLAVVPGTSTATDTVYVVWRDDTPGSPDIFLRKSTNGGSTFATSLNVSNNSGGSTDPQVVANSNTVYVAWRDTTPGNAEALFKRSTDGGATFEAVKNLSNTASNSDDQALAVSTSGRVYSAWSDTSFGNNREILLVRSQ
jgi:hypothetical protein